MSKLSWLNSTLVFVELLKLWELVLYALNIGLAVSLILPVTVTPLLVDSNFLMLSWYNSTAPLPEATMLSS